jgi:indole-3-acetate monooxygenase
LWYRVGMNDQLRAARALRSTICATRHQTEEGRRLAPAVVEGLLAGGLFRLAVPASLGGPETEPTVALQIYEELASADASVAWIVWNNQVVGLASRYSSAAVKADIFNDHRAIFANSTRPSGEAIVVDGGLKVSGRWSLVSGCELADWIPVMCIVQRSDQSRTLADGEPETRMAYLPKGSFRILDTWHVGGLRGTGSHDIVANDIFVPSERTFSFSDPVQDDRPLSQMPFFATVCAGCAAICLGVAQAARDTLLELASSKVQVDPVPATRDRPSVQTLLASSGAKLASARLLLYSALADVWSACTRGVEVASCQRASLWESGHHAAHVSRNVVRSMYGAAGASALYIECPLERAHRDIHAVMQHIVFASFWMEAAGQVRLGLTPGNPIF